MKILEIKKNIRTDKVESHREVSPDILVGLHPGNLDLVSWTRSGRINTRFSLTTSTEKYMYVKVDKYVEADVEKLAH